MDEWDMLVPKVVMDYMTDRSFKIKIDMFMDNTK